MSIAFARLATETASVKRPERPTSGVIGDMTFVATDIKCLPLDPVSAEIAIRLGTSAPYELLQTFVQKGVDIKEGDYLCINNREYPIKSCAEWKWPHDGLKYLHLIVEDIKDSAGL